MAEFDIREFLQVVVGEPGMIDQGLQDQRLALGNGGPVTAMDRARGKLLAHHHVGLPAAEARPAEARPGPVASGRRAAAARS